MRIVVKSLMRIRESSQMMRLSVCRLSSLTPSMYFETIKKNKLNFFQRRVELLCIKYLPVEFFRAKQQGSEGEKQTKDEVKCLND